MRGAFVVNAHEHRRWKPSGDPLAALADPSIHMTFHVWFVVKGLQTKPEDSRQRSLLAVALGTAARSVREARSDSAM
jgi:hypothetical protein